MNRLHKIYFIGTSIFSTVSLVGFSSLHEMVNYAATYDEIVEPDNHDLTNADYFSEYEFRQPSWQRWLANKIFPWFITASTIIDILKPLLTEITKSREIQGFNSRHVIRLFHKPGDVLIVWGDLQGDFHSCLRSLVELKKQGILDENLAVIKPNHYLIFNGNFTGETNETLELVACISSLMLKNPNQVFCLAGPLEDHDTWTDQGLIREVSAFTHTRGVSFALPHSVEQSSALYKLLTRFFNSLPLALYLDYPELGDQQELQHNLIRISGFGDSAAELDVHNFNDFFKYSHADPFSQQDTFMTYRLENIIDSAIPASTRIFITSVDGHMKFERTEGLVELEPLDGAIVWSIFSAPNIFQRRINHFYFDAFAKIALTKKLEDVTIELVHRDARTEEPFHVESKHFLLSGKDLIKRRANITKNNPVITIGADLDLSKGASSIGINIRKGALAALEDLQTAVDVHHKKLHLSFFDNEFSARKASHNVNDIERQYRLPIVAFPITIGVMKNYLPALQNGSLLALFPIDGTTELHSKQYPGIIFYRPSFEEEIRALIDDAILNTTDGSFCFFYQDDTFGKSALHVARAYMQQLGKKQWTEISHLPNETNFKHAIKTFKKHNFSSIFFFSFPLAIREFIQQLGTMYLIKADLYGISLLSGRELRYFLKELGLSMTLSQVVPNPETSTLAIAQEYRASMDSRGLPYGSFSFEGYICSALILDTLAHIKGTVTPEKIVKYLTSLKNYHFKGLTLTFRPEYRDLSQTIWIDQGELVWKEHRRAS